MKTLCFQKPVATIVLLFLSTACSATSPPMTHEHHAIDYIEITVHEMDAAKRFYAEAFGWTFQDYGPDYAGIQRRGGGESGGLRSDIEVRPGGPLVVLYSEDLEASQRAVLAAGGEVTQEIFEFPGGRRFHFRDPSGNGLAVWATAGE